MDPCGKNLFVDLCHCNSSWLCFYFNNNLAIQIEKYNQMEKLNSKIPSGPLAQKWTAYKASVKLVNPANKKKLDVIVIGTGLSGAAAASALGELGYRVKNFCYQDSPAPCPFGCCPGRYKRCKKLSE